jgi:hypothetical protein
MNPELAFVGLFISMTLFTLIWLLFYERRDKAPSMPERVLARVWLTARRLILFIVGLVFLTATLYSAFNSTWDVTTWKQELKSVGLGLLLSSLAFWVGMYGAGRRRVFSDDRKVHTERKKRYGWRW